MPNQSFPSPRPSGFTLVEIMLSVAIIALILLILVSIVSQTAQTWRYTTGKVEQFREARTAFERMTVRLSQATLNTYWDYDNPASPKRYERRSELRYINGLANGTSEKLVGNLPSKDRYTHCVFFHAPLGLVADTSAKGYRGLENLLNVWGYYVELGTDVDYRASFLSQLPARKRFRLMELMQPSEEMGTYQFTSGLDTKVPPGPKSESYTLPSWFAGPVNKNYTGIISPIRPLADNIVALIILPQLSKQDVKTTGGNSTDLAPSYSYDSTKKSTNKVLNPKNQLPPLIQITMVAIDEVSASRLNPADLATPLARFTKSADFDKDLKLDPSRQENDSLENKLAGKTVRASYRVFTTNVPIRAAKWSRSQSDN